MKLNLEDGKSKIDWTSCKGDFCLVSFFFSFLFVSATVIEIL